MDDRENRLVRLVTELRLGPRALRDLLPRPMQDSLPDPAVDKTVEYWRADFADLVQRTGAWASVQEGLERAHPDRVAEVRAALAPGGVASPAESEIELPQPRRIRLGFRGREVRLEGDLAESGAAPLLGRLSLPEGLMQRTLRTFQELVCANRLGRIEHFRVLGEHLWQALQGPAGQDLRPALARALAPAPGRMTRLELSFTDAPELAALPWELLADEDGFLSAREDLVLVRCAAPFDPAPAPRRTTPPPARLRVDALTHEGEHRRAVRVLYDVDRQDLTRPTEVGNRAADLLLVEPRRPDSGGGLYLQERSERLTEVAELVDLVELRHRPGVICLCGAVVAEADPRASREEPDGLAWLDGAATALSRRGAVILLRFALGDGALDLLLEDLATELRQSGDVDAAVAMARADLVRQASRSGKAGILRAAAGLLYFAEQAAVLRPVGPAARRVDPAGERAPVERAPVERPPSPDASREGLSPLGRLGG